MCHVRVFDEHGNQELSIDSIGGALLRPIYNLKESVLYNSQTQKLPFILDAFYLSVGMDSNPLNAREQVLKYQTFAIKLLVYIYIFLLSLEKNVILYINIEFQICPNLAQFVVSLPEKNGYFLSTNGGRTRGAPIGFCSPSLSSQGRTLTQND